MKRYLLVLAFVIFLLFAYTQILPSDITVKLGNKSYTVDEKFNEVIYYKETIYPKIAFSKDEFVNSSIKSTPTANGTRYKFYIKNYFGIEKTFQMTLKKELKKALIVMNMQNAYKDVRNSFEVSSNINTLVNKAHVQGIPVIFITSVDASSKGGSYGVRINDTLSFNEDDIVIEKKKDNAFDGTLLLEKLNTMGIEEVYMCGITSEGSLDKTADVAHRLGFNIIWISDANTTYGNDYEKIIKEINMKYIKLEKSKNMATDQIKFYNE